MPFRAFLPPKSPDQTSPNAKKPPRASIPLGDARRSVKCGACPCESRRVLAMPMSRRLPLRALLPAKPLIRSARPDAFSCGDRSQIAARLIAQSRLHARRALLPARPRVYPNQPRRKNRRASPAFSGLRGGFSHIYALASVSMAWAKILTLSMNFSQSIYSSGIWQVSVSPGKLMPKATVLGIMRE